MVVTVEEESKCAPCQNCGAEITIGTDKECPGCHKDVKECLVKSDVTSSVYPM